MPDHFNKWLRLFNGNAGVTLSIIGSFQKRFGILLPSDYILFLQHSNGGEGLVGQYSYVIFWKLEELSEFNSAYQVSDYAPGIFLIGSDGGGEAYGFDMNLSPPSIVQVPFVGMDRNHAIVLSDNFNDFLCSLYNFRSKLKTKRSNPVVDSGKEICEIKPVILGGDPTDLNNKIVLNRQEHIRLVQYWNRIIRDLRK